MKLRFLNLLSNRKILISLIPVLLVVALAVFLPNISQASISSVVTSILGVVVGAFVWVLGKILVLLINLVIWVAQYNDFINAKAVSNGWVILRDICNMFFILILLVIAFATTLNRESYAMKALLPKFIIAAILINFSKLICGVIIDFAQVIMLTFVNGFRDIGGGNLADMLGITDIMSISKDPCQEVSLWTVVGTFILAVIYILVATVVVTVILFVLVIRMIMIWVYVVLSPMAWLLSVLPATQKYSNQWWQQFAETVASGPILAFFIWLSFASIQIGVSGSEILGGLKQPGMAGNEEVYSKQIGGADNGNKCVGVGVNENGTPDGMLKFVISIGLLMGGLIITKQAGGAIGAVAGGGMSKITGAAKSLGNKLHRPITDRYKAFQGQRESARKARVEKFGSAAYGNYIGATGKIKGFINSTLSRAKTSAVSNVGALKTYFKGGSTTFKEAKKQYKEEVDNKRRKKQEKKDAKADKIDFENRRQEAYGSGEFKDKDGKTFYYHEPSGTYKPAAVDSKGEVIKDNNGNVIVNGNAASATENGKVVKKMSDGDYAALTSWNNATATSKAFNNTRQQENISKEKKKMEDAGFTPGQLLATLKNASLSQEKRMAAALTLAVKEGFKSRAEVEEAQALIKNSKNSGLQKEFNDTVDKKQAHLNYDLSTEQGRNKFAKRRADGKFDVLAADAYEDPRVMQALKGSMTDKEFMNYASKVSSYSSKHDSAIKNGIKKYLDKQPGGEDYKDGELDASRRVIKSITGDLNDVVRGDAANSGDKNKMEAMLTEAFLAMSTSEVGKLKASSFKADRSLFKDDAAAANYESAVRGAFNKAFNQPDDLKNINSNRNADKKTLQALSALLGSRLGDGPNVHDNDEGSPLGAS